MSSSWLKALNPEQLKAVTHDEGPLLILAGAGSGKTRALTYRAAYLLKEKQVPAPKVLLVTFTNKAAKEMRDRVAKLLKQNSSQNIPELPFAGTFHSFCARLLRIEGGYLDLDSDFVIYDESDALMTIKQALTNLNLDSKRYQPRPIKSIISQAKNELIGDLEYSQYAKSDFQQKVAQVYPEYQRLLKSYQAVDFDDLLMLSVKLLDHPQLLNKYRQKFEYVLVDEYQDTNKAQYQLTKKLSGAWRNLTVVGDAAQSIYSWRGADYRNLSNLKIDFPELTIINLEQNYRSTQNILSAANKVITQNTSHPVLKLWTNSSSGDKITIFEADDEGVESQFIIEQILKTGKSFHDFAVLYRTNAQSRVIEEAFIKRGVSYVLIGGTRFYDRKEIKDLLAYLRFFYNPKDVISYKRLGKLGKRKLTQFVTWLESNREKLAKKSSSQVLKRIIKISGYWDRFDEKDSEDAARLENIKELLSVAEQWPNMTEFLEQVALVEQADTKKGLRQNNDAVTLMTLHASKGLEFDTVFMIGMEEGLFPHSRSSFDKEQLEEERRLCYVGMTRAKQKLYFSYARRRLYFGTRNQNAVSRFLSEVDESLIDLLAPEDSLDLNDVIIDINDN
jgi:DNA helicase-2/ATP-dependent DNA helicase PcrA